MSIVPASCLSSSDLQRLGNNIRPPRTGASRDQAQRRRHRQFIATLNRSLASVGESISRFDRQRSEQAIGVLPAALAVNA